jgi:hypothetical protein
MEWSRSQRRCFENPTSTIGYVIHTGISMRGLSVQFVNKRDKGVSVASPVKGLLLVVVLAALIYLFRDWHQFANPQFWAEDATVFFADSMLVALVNFVQPYAGYFHFGPRLLALCGAAFPTVDAPVAFFYGAVAAAIASSMLIYLIVESLPPHLRVLFSLAPLLVLPSGEVYGSVTNIQWFWSTAFGVLILAYRGDRFRSRIWLILGAALALTGPFSVAFWPCFLAWSFLTRRLRMNALMLTVVGIGALIQLTAVLVLGTNKYGVGIAGAASWVRAGKIFVTTFVTLHGIPAAVATTTIVALLAVGLFRNLHKLRAGYLPFGLACLSMLTLAMGLWTHKHMPDLLNPLGPGERYYFQPFAFLLMAIVASATAAGKAHAQFCLVAVALLVFGWGRHFRLADPMDYRWRDYYALSHVVPDAAIPIRPDWVMKVDWAPSAYTVPHFQMDMSKLVALNGNLSTEGTETSLARPAQNGTVPKVIFDVPAQCRDAMHRFLRVSANDPMHVHLYFPNVAGNFSEQSSLSSKFGAGGHWYFDVPRGIAPQVVRLDLAGDSTDVVHSLDLQWVCW